MKKTLKKTFAFATTALTLSTVLAAPAANLVHAQEEGEGDVLDFSPVAENEGEPIEGGTYVTP